MAERDVVETIYGKYSKYEIVKRSSLLGSPTFYIVKDGEVDSGSFSSLRAAVEEAKDRAG